MTVHLEMSSTNLGVGNAGETLYAMNEEGWHIPAPYGIFPSYRVTEVVSYDAAHVPTLTLIEENDASAVLRRRQERPVHTRLYQTQIAHYLTNTIAQVGNRVLLAFSPESHNNYDSSSVQSESLHQTFKHIGTKIPRTFAPMHRQR